MTNKYGFDGEVPPNVSLENNIRIALEFRNSHSNTIDRLTWFNNMVRSNKDHHLPYDKSWDYKQIDGKYADFGNFNYGAVGIALGLTPEILKWGAGAAQIVSNTGSSKISAIIQASFYKNYGDNPEDQLQIMKGILYAESLKLAEYSELGNRNIQLYIDGTGQRINYKNKQETEAYIKELWDKIPANDIYYDQNHKYNHKKLMDLNNKENMDIYKTVLEKIINALPDVAKLSNFEQLQVINQAYVDKGKEIEYIPSAQMLKEQALSQEQSQTLQLDANNINRANLEETQKYQASIQDSQSLEKGRSRS